MALYLAIDVVAVVRHSVLDYYLHLFCLQWRIYDFLTGEASARGAVQDTDIATMENE